MPQPRSHRQISAGEAAEVLADLEEHFLVGGTQAQPGADLCPGGWGDHERR
jgi:hypothetical protein